MPSPQRTSCCGGRWAENRRIANVGVRGVRMRRCICGMPPRMRGSEMENRLGELCVPSPLGTILLTALDDALLSVRFVDNSTTLHSGNRAAATLSLAWRELDAYFAGELDEFTVRLARRNSPFQLKVLDA